MKYKFNIEEVFRQSWSLTKKHFLTMLGIGALMFIISLPVSFLQGVIQGISKATGYYSFSFMFMDLILEIIGFAINAWLTFNLFKILLDVVDGKDIKISDIYKLINLKDHHWVKWLIAYIVYGLAVFIGLVLFIIPGIYIAIKFSPALYILTEDKEIDIVDAFKKASLMTDGEKWHLVGVGALSILVVFVGLLLLIVGLIPALMIVTFVNVVIYRKLQGHHHTKAIEA